jgi:4a-hydroxytetrahydrobiopterin dehydratase
MAEALSSDKITQELTKVTGWSLANDAKSISKKFQFKDFREAFSFMTACALWAEKADHHPDWSNVYNRVDVTLSTHDAGGVTEKDIAFAAYMDEITA